VVGASDGDLERLRWVARRELAGGNTTGVIFILPVGPEEFGRRLIRCRQEPVGRDLRWRFLCVDDRGEPHLGIYRLRRNGDRDDSCVISQALHAHRVEARYQATEGHQALLGRERSDCPGRAFDPHGCTRYALARPVVHYVHLEIPGWRAASQLDDPESAMPTAHENPALGSRHSGRRVDDLHSSNVTEVPGI
jgi:hypothetical protein